MNMAQSLLEFILNLLRDSNAKTAFIADPEKALADAGLSGVCGKDVADAMSYVAEYHPVTFVGDRDRNDSNTNIAHDTNVAHHGGDDSYHPDPHATAVQQLEYVTNNYSYIDNHDTVIDKSVHQDIWNEGILTQSFDDHSVTATDHSVAAGRDIDGNVTNGNDNVVGDGNYLGNTTTTRWEDHSTNDSFNGSNVADRGGVAGTNNDGTVTNPYDSDAATTGGWVDESKHDSHDRELHNEDYFNRDSFNRDSFNRESSNHESSNYDFNNDESFNRDFNNDESYNNDSAFTHTEQHGFLNANLGPVVNIPVHHNDVDVLSE